MQFDMVHIDEELGLPLRVEACNPHIPNGLWMLIGSGNTVHMEGDRETMSFICNAINRAAGGNAKKPIPKFRKGDVVRVLKPFRSGDFSAKRWDETFNWVGQRAVVVDVCATTYGIYLASEGPSSYCAWWDEAKLEKIK